MEPKIEEKTDLMMEQKMEPNIEPNMEQKMEPNMEPKIEPNIEPKMEQKMEPTIEPNIEPKMEQKMEPKMEPKMEKKDDQKRSGSTIMPPIMPPKIPQKFDHKWMCAIDGSIESVKGFLWLLNFLRTQKEPSKNHVILISYIPKESLLQTTPEYIIGKNEIEQSLLENSKMLEEISVPSKIRIIEDCSDVRKALCQQVEGQLIDTLVMGNSGKNALERVILGSVSEYCVRHAKSNVIICRDMNVISG